MTTKNKSAVRWPLITGYLGIIVVLMACMTVGGGDATLTVTATATLTETAAPTGEPLLRLEDGAVKVQGEDNTWIPVTGQSTFELVGVLESTDPWMVTGNTFATRDTTQIAEGLEAGDLVRVKGVILEDATWLANSIELAEEQVDPTVTLIGNVDSIDPWVVHGITLNVTAETTINGEITPDMIVLVEILLLEDGTWEVLSITPLSHFTEIPGCLTVMATVSSVSGNEIQLVGWPVIILGDDVEIENEEGGAGTLSANQPVLVVVCTSEGGQVIITKIILLHRDDDSPSAEGKKVLICHKPDKKGGHTLSIAEPAVSAHLAHGDRLGACT
jgi:hypothetical protein